MGRCETITNNPARADDASALPRVLVLTHRVPFPPDRGDRIRSYHLLGALAGRARVTLGAVSDQPVTDAQREALAELVEQAVIRPLSPMQIKAGALKALVRGQALTPGALFHPALANKLIAIHRNEPFDTVVTFCSGMLGYAEAVLGAGSNHVPDQQLPGGRGSRRAANTRELAAPQEPRPPREHPPRPRHILDLVDVDSLKWRRYAEQSRGPKRWLYALEARRLRMLEAGDPVPFDALTVISDREARAYRRHITADVEPIVAGNGVDLERFCPAPVIDARTDEEGRPPTIVFTGVLSYKPNADAVAWFARRVMPRVLAAVPQAVFEIVGKSPTAAVNALGELPGVSVVGEVADTVPYLQGAAVVVAPLKIAPGVQNKVLEAMSCGRPVVASPAAAAGIDATPGEHLIVADDAPATAKAVAALLLNPSRRTELGNAARARVQACYDWPARLGPLLDRIAPPPPGQRNPTTKPQQTHTPVATL